MRQRRGGGASRQRQRGEGRFPDGLGGPGRGPGPPVMENLTMAKAIQKIAMNAAENIPYDKLILSQKNVRRVKDGVSIEQLAEDIGRRKLLQSLNVRPVLDEDGRGNRHVRGARRRPPLSRARHPHQAEAPGEERADPLHRQPQRSNLGRRGLARRKSAPCRPPSARPVPRFQDPERPGPRSGRNRRPLLRVAGDGEAAPEAGIGLAEAARPLRKGRDQARAGHGVLDLATTMRGRSRCGSGSPARTCRSPTTSSVC